MCESDDGETGRLVSKYRPMCPVLLVTTRDDVAAHTNCYFAQYAHKVSALGGGLAAYKACAASQGLCPPEAAAVLVTADGSISIA